MTLITKHALRPLWSLIGPLIGPDLVLHQAILMLAISDRANRCDSYPNAMHFSNCRLRLLLTATRR